MNPLFSCSPLLSPSLSPSLSFPAPFSLIWTIFLSVLSLGLSPPLACISVCRSSCCFVYLTVAGLHPSLWHHHGLSTGMCSNSSSPELLSSPPLFSVSLFGSDQWSWGKFFCLSLFLSLSFCGVALWGVLLEGFHLELFSLAHTHTHALTHTHAHTPVTAKRTTMSAHGWVYYWSSYVCQYNPVSVCMFVEKACFVSFR